MRIINKIYKWCTATRLRKLLSSILAILILFTSIRFLFLKPKEALAADVYLGFDEGYGTSSAVHDTNSSISAGSITNAVWKSEEFCKVGKCLYFDGTGDYVSFGDNANLDMGSGQAVTIEGWFRTPDITSGTRTLLAKEEPTGVDGGYRIEMNSSGFIVFGIDNDNTSFPSDSVTSTAAYDDNQWHHFAAVKNAGTSMTLYIDAVSVGTPDPSPAADVSNDDTFYIGIYNGSSNGWSGFIDEVKVLRSARTADQVKADFNGATSSGGSSVSFGSSQDFLSDGLVGYWKLDESSWTGDCTATSVTDSSGNGKNGKACPNASAPTVASGKFGNAGIFDGTNDYIQVSGADTGGLATRDDITVSFWMKRNVLTQKGALVDKSNTNGDYDYYISIDDGSCSDNQLGFYVDAPNYFFTCSTGTISDTNWHHVVFTRNKSSTTFYIDGISSGTSTTIGTGQFNNLSTTLQFGNEVFSSTPYSGNLDDIRIYNRAFSPAEVQELYNWAPGPVGYWKMDENSGSSLNDSSSYVSTAVTLSGNPLWKHGKYGSALNFDGVDDYGDGPSDSDIQITGDLTLATWVNISGSISDQDNLFNYRCASAGSTCNTLYVLRVRTTSGNDIEYTHQYGSQSSETNSFDTNLNTNTWYHVAVVRDVTAKTVKLYINGVQTGATFSYTNDPADGSAANLRIGNSASGGARSFDGMMDNLQIFNYAQKPSQIIEDMNAGSSLSASSAGGALGHWSMDEGYLTTVHNSGSAGSSADGTFAGTPNPTWTNNGKFGKAVNFVTSGDNAITLTNTVSTKNQSEYSISAWLKPASLPTSGNNMDIWADTTADLSTAVRSQVHVVNNALGCGTNVLGFSFRTGTSASTRYNICGTTTLSTGNWYQVVAVFNSNSGIHKLYVNGKEEGTLSQAVSAIDNTDPNVVPRIGIFANGNSDFDGVIDEVSFYNTALTAEQVKTEYNQGTNTVMGSASTDSSGNSSWSSTDEYCPPGQGTTCTRPVGEWKLDENTGQTAYDTGSGGNNGSISTVNNPASWRSGKFGQSLHFPGSTGANAVSMGDPAGLDFGTGSFTYQLWVNIDGSTGATQIPIYKGGSSSGSAGYDFELNAGGTWKLHYGDGTAPNYVSLDITTSAASYYGKWIQLTGVIDRTNNLAISYLNGVRTNSTSIAGFGSGDNTTNFQLGNYSNGTTPLKGSVDNVQVYNYARTPAQIAWDYNKGGPVGWWEMDESSWNGTAGEVKDSSGNALHGVRNGNATTTTTAKINNGGTFDGTGDYVSVADNSILDFGTSTPFSVSTWVKLNTNTSDDTLLGKIKELTGPTSGGWRIVYDDTNAKMYAELTSDVWNFYCAVRGTSTNIEDGNWHHIAVVYNRNASCTTSDILIYIDGKAEPTTVVASGNNTNANMDNANPLNIGAYDINGTITSGLNGYLDDVRIYNYPLSLQQIKIIMNNNSALRFTPITSSP